MHYRGKIISSIFAPIYARYRTIIMRQGAERNVIIFSSVYGSEEGCYFINSNKSLMNVAVSRAKDSFLVFGDSGCLEGNPKSAGGMLKRMTEREII